MTVMLFGASGQLGTSISALANARGVPVDAVPRTVDIADDDQVAAAIADARPDWIINAAAMTDVDGAHLNPRKAMDINGLAPGVIARAAEAIGARVIQISTEAVFDGERVEPYREDDSCDPVSVYGAAKLAGESLVRIYSPDSYVLRTSWLYSGVTGMNFPTRILAQLADPARPIAVVTDVIGNPTPTTVLAEAILAVMQDPPEPGTYHVCCREPASKHEWAVQIAESAGFDSDRIRRVTSADYPTVARRPTHVDLDCGKFLATGRYALPTWREAWLAVARTDPS